MFTGMSLFSFLLGRCKDRSNNSSKRASDPVRSAVDRSVLRTTAAQRTGLYHCGLAQGHVYAGQGVSQVSNVLTRGLTIRKEVFNTKSKSEYYLCCFESF